MFDSIEIDRTICPNDEMFVGDLDHSFSVGRSGLACIQRALAARGEGRGDPTTILDFPCGHGRVLRYLRAAFPGSEITACDLLRDGVDFCRAQFGVAGVYSCEDPARIPLPRDSFDLIWVGSLLTHFDAPRWDLFLTFFRSLLRPGGVLVFSTCGRRTHEWIVTDQQRFGLGDADCTRLCRDFESTNFGYVNYGNSIYYGLSLSDASWVCRLITSMTEFRLLSFGERAWDDHQDVFACVRDVGWKAHLNPPPSLAPRSRDSATPNPPGRPLHKRIFDWRRSA